MARIKVPVLRCQRCGHTWRPRTEDVRQCPNPKCHTLFWDKPKGNKNEKTAAHV